MMNKYNFRNMERDPDIDSHAQIQPMDEIQTINQVSSLVEINR